MNTTSRYFFFCSLLCSHSLSRSNAPTNKKYDDERRDVDDVGKKGSNPKGKYQHEGTCTCRPKKKRKRKRKRKITCKHDGWVTLRPSRLSLSLASRCSSCIQAQKGKGLVLSLPSSCLLSVCIFLDFFSLFLGWLCATRRRILVYENVEMLWMTDCVPVERIMLC